MTGSGNWERRAEEMLKLLVLREQLRAFYGKNSTVLTALIRFMTALISMICLN